MAKKRHSHFVKKGIKVKYVWDALDSAGVANSVVSATPHGTGVYIPKGAIVTDVLYLVPTGKTFTSAGADAGEMAISIEGAGDVLASVAISGTNDPWDAGMHATLVGVPALSVFHASNNPTALEYIQNIKSKYIVTTAERELTVTVAAQALTAGEMDIYVEYIMP